MWSNQNCFQYISQLQTYIQQQNLRIERLEATLSTIEEQLKTIEENTGGKIDKIEYHFDQLKIETLEGTLNIGLTPNVPGTIEDFSTGSNNTDRTPVILQTHPNLFPKVKQQIEHLLRKDGHALIQSKAHELRHQLDPSIYPFILQDVQSQLDNRIMSYLNQITPNQVEKDGEDAIVAHISTSIRSDIENGLQTFMQNMQRGG